MRAPGPRATIGSNGECRRQQPGSVRDNALMVVAVLPTTKISVPARLGRPYFGMDVIGRVEREMGDDPRNRGPSELKRRRNLPRVNSSEMNTRPPA